MPNSGVPVTVTQSTPASPPRSHSLTSSHLRFPLGQVFRKHTAWRMLQGSERGAAGWEAGGWAAAVPAPQGFWLASAGGSALPHILLSNGEGGREGGRGRWWEGGRRRLAPRRAGKLLRAARPWWPRAPPALPPLSRHPHSPPPGSCRRVRCPSRWKQAAGSCWLCAQSPCQASPESTAPTAPRAPMCPERVLSPQTPDAPTGQNPKTPASRAAVPQQPHGAPGLSRSSCCLTQRDASGLNVTSRRRLAGAGGRAGGSVAEAQVQKGRANLALASPLPLSPSLAVAASAVARTDEGSEKQSFSTPADGSKQLLPPSFFCAGSTCGLPPACPAAATAARPSVGGSGGWKGAAAVSGQGWLSLPRSSLGFEGTLPGANETPSH